MSPPASSASLPVADARSVFIAGVRSVSPDRLFQDFDWDKLGAKPLAKYRRLWVAAVGKAGLSMSNACFATLPVDPHSVLAVVPRSLQDTVSHDVAFPVLYAGHPIPDAGSIAAADEVAEQAGRAGRGDLFLVLLSGGGSALLGAPRPPIRDVTFRRITDELLKSGAPIDQINVVRRSLARLAGGRLAALARPAEVVTLAISDVVGDDPATIASGPTVLPTSTNQDARRVLERLGLWIGLAEEVREVLNRSDAVTSPATTFKVLGSNRTALDSAALHARMLGYRVVVAPQSLTGEARIAGRQIAQTVLRAEPGTCFLWGGETTVTVRGSGKGGRNQELALAAGIAIMETDSPAVILSAGTDGRDGPTDAAGAWVSAQSMRNAFLSGLDPQKALDNNDSYSFFSRAGGHLKTGPTHTNVMDMQIAIVPAQV